MDEKDEKYTMKRKRYGWGWIPVTWQGWVFIFAQVGIIVIAATLLPHKPAHPSTDQLLRFFGIFGLAFLNLIIFSLETSPRPKWRWGKKSSDNPDEDF